MCLNANPKPTGQTELPIRKLKIRSFLTVFVVFSSSGHETIDLKNFSPQWSATGGIKINLYIKFHYSRNETNASGKN